MTKKNNTKNNKVIRIIAISLIVAVFLFVIAPFLFSIFVYSYYFDKRFDCPTTRFEYISEQYDYFERDEQSFTSNNDQTLNGAFYYSTNTEEPTGLVVWMHGMNSCHEDFLGEFKLLIDQGYVVFGFDATGVGISGGDKLIGLSQYPIDLSYALNFVDTFEQFKNVPLILIGHSQGGYSVSSVCNLDIPRDPDAIISLAGFWINSNAATDLGGDYVGPLIHVIVPYLSICDYWRFGNLSTINGVDGFNSTNADILIIHSQDDDVVNFYSNYLKYVSEFENNDRFTFIELVDAGHHITLDYDSHEKIHDLTHEQAHYETTSNEYKALDEEKCQYMEDYNEYVMDSIIDFCNNVTI